MGSACNSLLAVITVFAISYFSAGCSSPPPLPSYGVVPDFTLTDQAGQPFHSKDKLDGHVWVADFIYTNCMGPCPRMSTQMNKIRRDIDDNPRVKSVSFTIDPERDTPAVLAAYGKRYKADPDRWYLLTGSRTDLKRLNWDTFHLGDVNSDLEHSTRFVLIDSKSRIRGYYDSADPESMQQLTTDIKRLVKDAG